MPKKMTKLEFIEKARKVHGDKYDYSKVEYVNNYTKVCIICPTHGEFWQTPNAHLSRRGCPKCKGERLSSLNRKTTEEFIEEAKLVHGNKYDYSKVNYKTALDKVCIVCPIHGEFWQTPAMHLSGQGCFKCSVERNASNCKLTKDEFIEKAKKVHGNKYDYSKVNYINNHTKICIICPKHGEFWQMPYSHLSGHECPKCSRESIKEGMFVTFEEFVKRAKKVHGNKYDYSLAKNLKGLRNKIKIICPMHGEYEQRADDHLKGCGCPKCKDSFLERTICQILENKHIYYEFQKKFSWLGNQSLDFYIPSLKIGIECQGIQHFKAFKYFGGEKGFENRKKLDIRKYKLCKKNSIKLLYYTELPQYFTFLGETLIKNENTLLKLITEKEK